MTENGVSPSNRNLVVDPQSSANLVGSMTNMFNPSAKISSIFKDGALGDNILGFNFAEDANTPSFTPLAAGTWTALAAIPASGATTITTTATGTSTLPSGTVFTIAGVYAINPQSRQSTGSLMQFVVTADTVLAASSTNVIPFYPAYIPSDSTVVQQLQSAQFATCTGTPTSTAAITMLTGAVGAGPYSQNIAFNKDAFTFACCDLILPRGVDMAEREVHEGISMRMIRQYDISSNMFPVRFDVLGGWKTVYPELACRLIG